MSSEAVQLDQWTATSDELVCSGPGAKLTCVACAHRCALADGKRGICLMRTRSGAELRVPYGYTAGVAADPIEKKPFFHVRPGSIALSFGMLGCDLHCSFCQNWFTSQTLRDPRACQEVRPASAESIVDTAVRSGARAIVSTYNEPLITSEWAHDVFAAARGRDLLTGYVSNGHGTPEVLEYLRPVMDLFKIDLKAFTDAAYRELGGHLGAVLETVRGAWEMGLWVEVVTLLVPGFNDDAAELDQMAEFLASVSVDVPWHVTAFHPDYRWEGGRSTSVASLMAAREAGRKAGLRHVYTGNLPGQTGDGENTFCPHCGATVVRRMGFRVRESRLNADGACSDCGGLIAGRW
jgi:pyruvate formate lyase activating enzyme